MAAILLAGAVAYYQLPVSALPQVDYPTIQVLTFYPGASPEVVASAITAPLERQFGQVPGLQQMTSTSGSGSSVITLQFVLDLNIDVAQQDVQAAINAADSFLPRDLPNPPIYSKINPADAPILTLALTSQTLPLSKVQDLADTRLAQKISQLPGVGMVSISGGQKPAIRIQANPMALGSYGLTLEDLRTAIAQANVNQPKGSFDGSRQAYTIGANDQILSSADYRTLIVAYNNEAPVRLSDVADVIDSAENVKQAAWMNTVPAVLLNVQRQPGANIIKVVDRIKELLPKLKASLPATVDVSILIDRTVTIRASVKDVQFELMLTIALVVMVMFLFVRTLAATVIPSVAVPLSLVGTFGAMYLLGYSLNNLTLMALTISTGFVVDDAIVMIENIVRYIEAGEAPLQAALKGAEQIGFTILSLTVSLIAVLIPLLFMGDIVGRLFREFAVTLSVTILLSAVVSLTLTPMMCARMLRHKPESEQGWFYRTSERAFKAVIAFYGVDAALGAAPPVRHAGGGRGHPGNNGMAVRDGAQGFFSGTGYGGHSGHFGSAADGIVSGHGRASAGPGRGDLTRPGGGEPVVFYWRRWHQHDAQQRPHPDQLKTARRAARSAPATSSAGCKRSSRQVEGITLFMQPVQDLTVEDRVSRTQYQYSLEAPDAQELQPVGGASGAETANSCHSSVMWPAMTRLWACRRCSSSIAIPPHALASARRPSMIRCIVPLASARFRPFLRNRTSIVWCWKSSRSSRTVCRICSNFICARRRVDRCRSAP